MQKLKAVIFTSTCASILFICSVATGDSNNCSLRIKGKILSLASLNGTWPLIDKEETGNYQYEISLCGPVNSKGVNDACRNSSICRTENGHRTSLADFSDGIYQATLLSDFSWLMLNGHKCLVDTSKNYQVILHFMCGATIGSPELYLSSDCAFYFSWTTSAVCDIQPKRKEVPCYVYDKDTGIKHDLQPLIKSKGGYAVTGTGTDSLVINICSDIIPDSATVDCPAGAAACLKREGKFYNVGHLKNALSFTRYNKLMQITYEDDGKDFPPGCDRAPKTVITFLCPQQENSVHGPQLVASNNCQFEIVWEVIYACPEEAFSGNVKTCKFTNIYHGLEFDLSPLRRDDSPYRAGATVNNTRVSFYLNVCGGLGGDFQCNEKVGANGWKSTSACLLDHESASDTITGRVIGTLKNAQLHYTDGSISLVYTGNRGCNGTNAYWGTVINFLCNESEPEGVPRFVGQEECLYIFDWSTKYACPKRYSNHTCSLAINGSVQIDLHSLQRKAGWRVIDGTNSNGMKRHIFLNVCGTLEKSDATSKCPSGSAICLTDSLNYAVALGRYSSLKYDAENAMVTIDYISGDSCGSEPTKSTLKLFCKPGDTSSSPVLVKESKCSYEFEWHTGAACPRIEHKGQDCKIDDGSSGLQFDLSPLTSEKAYEARSDSRTFFINVCAPVKGTECSLVKNAPTSNIGACATNLKNPEDNFSLGNASSDLVYKNGFLFLSYIGPTMSDGSARNMSIIFICDQAAGIGQPQFVDQLGEWYLFYWRTTHACLSKTFVDCTAVDSRTGVQYDLSSLAKLGKNMSWTTVDRPGKQKFYLNICQPLLLDSSLCSGQAAVCAVNIKNGKEEKAIPNLGQALSSPVVQSDGHLVLTYTQGDECISYGKKVNYTTTIHFICHGDDDQGIRFLGFYGTCNYSFLWATAAACSLENEESQNTCNVTDSVSGQVYNMMPLKLANSFYNVTSRSRKFRLNICGPVGNKGCDGNNGSVSACEVTSSGSVKNVLSVVENYTLQVSPDMPVRLTYSNSTAADGKDQTTVSSVVISFKCSENVSDVHFIQQQGLSYYFEMATPLACKQTPIFCSIDGPRGEHYDLTPLGHSPFKIASDTRPHMDTIHYQISFCSPLEYSLASPCHGAGACQMNLTEPPSEVSLGYQQKALELLEDGSIMVRFMNGSKCESRPNIKNSAEVKLHCSYKEHPVVFLGVESCKYKFFLETPAACFIQTYKGSNCAVTDLVSGQVFNLTPLKKENSNYQVKHEEYIYLLNVCDELQLPPRGCEGFGACQTKESDKNFAVNTGMANKTLIYKDGLIQLTYSSGKNNCHKKYTRKTVITFVCDYTTDGIEEGPYFITEEDDCTYAFLWRTSYACRPYETVDCTTQDANGTVYELGTLALSTDNYYVKDPLNSNRTFAINVCRTLVSQPKFRCSSSSAACLLDKSLSNPKSQFPAASLGTKMESPKFNSGRLTLKYSLGESCVMFGKETHYETIIEFRCNVKEKFTTPEFIKQVGCKFFFLWETSAACPTSNRTAASNNCTVTDPKTGQVFNLTSLVSSKPTKVKIGSTQQFFLSVCQSFNGTHCGTVSGACQYEKGKILRAGNANSLLHYQDEVLYLNYTGGDKCRDGSSERNTVIEFVCSHETSGPRFISRKNDCTYTFQWYTPLACQKELPCLLEKDGVTIDLSALANNANVTTIIHSSESRSSYFINICQPLKPAVSRYCPSSAAICKVPFGTSTTWSLGRLWRSPYLDEEEKVTIEYKEGSTCPIDETKRLSSKIIFLCDYHAGKGEPEFISFNQCEYIFEWRTSVVCTAEMLPKLSSSQCTFEDKNKGFVIDLSKLWRNEKPYEVKSSAGSNFYLVNVCGGTRTEGPCKKASVCAVQGNKYGVYGSFENSSLTMKGGRLLLTSETSEICYEENNLGKKKTEIIFTCDQSAGVGSPILYKEFPCSAVFLWNTSVTCPQSIPKCTLLDGNNFYDLRMFSSISHSWSVIDKEGNIYWLNVCNEVRHEVILAKNHSCPPGTAVCRVGKDGKGISIGAASSLKLFGNGANGVEGLTLQYQNGDETCTLANGSKVAISTHISFLCDKSMQQPTFVKGPGTSCTYEFQWKMIGGCPETEPEEVYEKNGFIYHERFPRTRINLTSHINEYFIADEVHRDKYVYLFRIGAGVKPENKSNPCYRAAVCQTKPNASFFRDLGSVHSQHFFMQGNDLKLVLTSHGKRCGKNNNKNVTTTVLFHCAQNEGLGSPEFLYESNNCDYLFNWETSAMCNPVAEKSVADVTSTSRESHISVSTEVIVGLVLSLTLIVVLIGVFAKEERRSAVIFKMKSCFHKVKLPRYRYIQSAHSDGDPILLSPDEPLQRFHEESDSDIIT